MIHRENVVEPIVNHLNLAFHDVCSQLLVRKLIQNRQLSFRFCELARWFSIDLLRRTVYYLISILQNKHLSKRIKCHATLTGDFSNCFYQLLRIQTSFKIQFSPALKHWQTRHLYGNNAIIDLAQSWWWSQVNIKVKTIKSHAGDVMLKYIRNIKLLRAC